MFSGKRYKALISWMADFAHLTDHLLLKSQSAVFYSFHELGHKITISQFGTTVAVKRDVPKNCPKLLSFRNISVSVNFITQVTFFFLVCGYGNVC